jgi:hypothetical protein
MSASAQKLTVSFVIQLVRTLFAVLKNAQRHILLQNENGPCPLLAAANALFLRGDIELPRACVSSGVASLDDISNVLADQALQNAGEHSFHLNELLTIFPSLQDGMDINPKFTSGVSGMEYTSHLTAFEMLRVDIVHGWLLDPQDLDMVELIGNRTYNELVELVIAGKDAEFQRDKVQDEIATLRQQYETFRRQRLAGYPQVDVVDATTTADEPLQRNSSIELQLSEATPSTEPCAVQESIELAELTSLNEEDFKNDLGEKTLILNKLGEEATTGSLIDNFLRSTCHQLTTYGLMELYNHVEPDGICVFFRNNHFCTMTKHDGVLYLLVTDLGYANVPEIMWEKLDAIDGDTEYMTPAFTKASPQSDLLPPSSSGPSPETMLAQRTQNDYDYQVALELSKGTGSADMSSEDPGLAAAKQASLLEYNTGVGTLSLEESDALAAKELQAQFDRPSTDEASLALARKLQEEEYQQANANRRATNARRPAANNQQAEKSSCVLS